MGFYGGLNPRAGPVKILVTLVLLVAVFLLLMEVVFPLVSQYMPYNDVSV